MHITKPNVLHKHVKLFCSVGLGTLCLKVCGPSVGIPNYTYRVVIGGCDLALVAIVNQRTFLFKFLNQS